METTIGGLGFRVFGFIGFRAYFFVFLRFEFIVLIRFRVDQGEPGAGYSLKFNMNFMATRLAHMVTNNSVSESFPPPKQEAPALCRRCCQNASLSQKPRAPADFQWSTCSYEMMRRTVQAA